MEELLSLKEVMAMAKCSESTVWRAVKSGSLPRDKSKPIINYMWKREVVLGWMIDTGRVQEGK